MNLEYIVYLPWLLLIVETIEFYIYIKRSRKVIKTLLDTCQSFQKAGREMFAELETLKEQYRILTKVNAYFKRPTKK